MNQGRRFIFRNTAIRHYALGRTKSVLPQFTSPRVRTLLWVIAGVLLCSAVLAWLIHIPVYASGVGAVIDSVPLSAPEVGSARRMAIFLPERERSNVHAGQRVFCTFDKRGRPVSLTLTAVEAQISSPIAVQTRFKLTGAAAAVITKPVVTAFANLDSLPGNLPASAYAANVYSIDVEVGRMRAISLLPFILSVE
jgi:hypothetical protein